MSQRGIVESVIWKVVGGALRALAPKREKMSSQP